MEDDAPTPENPAPEGRSRPIREYRRARLQLLVTEFGGPKALGVLTKSPDTHFTAVLKGRRNVGDELAAKLEDACGKGFGWMDLPVQPLTMQELTWPEGHLVELFRRLEDPHLQDEATMAVNNILTRESKTASDAAPFKNAPYPAAPPAPKKSKT